MKQIIRALTSIILCVALAAGLCACSWRKNYTSRKDIEPMVIEYVEDKYGFTPEITDWETEAFRSKCEHYVTLKNGNEEFKVMVDTVLIITDNYESEKIDKAVTEWIDERMPGIYYAHVQNEYFNKDEKLEGSVWELFKNNSKYLRITATYVGKSFDDLTGIEFMSEIKAMGLRSDCTLLSCPDEKSAETVCKKAFPNGYIDIINYAPYINESFTDREPYGPQHKIYDTRNAGNCLYAELVSYGSEPVPVSKYSVTKAGENSSYLCSTYKITTELNGSSDMMELFIFIPMSEIKETPVYQHYHDSNRVDNMNYIYGSFPDDITSKGIFSVYGDFAVFQLNVTGRETYFSIAGK